MKKNGFSLLEILVSVVLVSVVFIFMLNSLIKLKTIYNKSDSNTDILLLGSTLSRVVNNDIKENEGINTVSCYKEDDELISSETDSFSVSTEQYVLKSVCDITFNNSKIRKLVLRNFSTIRSWNEDGIVKTNVLSSRSTVEYISMPSDELIYIKTLDYSVDRESYYYVDLVSNEENSIKTITLKSNENIYDVKFYSR